MVNRSSNFNLLILNLWLGLCRGSAGLPTAIADLGYSEKWIETKFKNQDNEIFHPEIVLSSLQTKHTMLIESKSGKNTEVDQLRRYSRVVRDDLTQELFLDQNECQKHDVVIVARVEHKDTICLGVTNGNYIFPVLTVSDDAITLCLNDFTSPECTAVFRPRLDIDCNTIPVNFVPFDNDSATAVVAEYVMQDVVNSLIHGETKIYSRRVLENILPIDANIMAGAASSYNSEWL